MTEQIETFLRSGDVQTATGLGRSFPAPVKVLGPRVSAWLASEVSAWQQARIAERDGSNGGVNVAA